MYNLKGIVFGICLTLNISASAQINLPSDKSSFYWDVNSTITNSIYEAVDKNLNIKYFDKFGITKDVQLKIYDWKREEVARLLLDKTFGLNYYTIGLEDISGNWESNQLYLCEIQDEKQRKYEWQLMFLKKSDQNIQVDILVNPIQFECESISGNEVEFYGAIKNGKPPYSLQWYVMNNNKSEFLYKPEEETIQSNYETSVIRVDQQPDYYVMLFVKDACDNIQQKTVHLICEEGKKKINSLFVEPIQIPMSGSLQNK